MEKLVLLVQITEIPEQQIQVAEVEHQEVLVVHLDIILVDQVEVV